MLILPGSPPLSKAKKSTVDTVARFSRFFGNSLEFCLNMQSRYDLEVLMEKKEQELKKVAADGAALPLTHRRGWYRIISGGRTDETPANRDQYPENAHRK